mgnify:CR=1 FL=1
MSQLPKAAALFSDLAAAWYGTPAVFTAGKTARRFPCGASA